MNITELIKEAHENACDKGFYPEGENKNIGELLMLVVSELGEALEAHRKDRFTNKEFLNSKTVTHKNGFESFIKDTFEDELADAIIRICDMCGYMNIDLEKHIELKMLFNSTREKLHGKKY